MDSQEVDEIRKVNMFGKMLKTEHVREIMDDPKIDYRGERKASEEAFLVRAVIRRERRESRLSLRERAYRDMRGVLLCALRE